MKQLYRYVIEYSSSELCSETKIILKTYTVLKETDCFYYIDKQETRFGGYSMLRAIKVGKNVKNTFAYDDKNKAQKNFIKRTESRIGYLNYFTDECETALKIIKKQGFKEI